MAGGVVVLLLFVRGAGLEAQTWNVNGNGSWNTASNWSPATVPDAIDATATLGSVITSNRVVTLAAPVTVGTLAINDDNRYTVSGGTITFDVGSGEAALTASGAGGGSGGHTISSAISMNDPLGVTSAAGGNLTVSGAIANNGYDLRVASGSLVTLSGAISGAGRLVLDGPGTVTLSGTANTFTGTTSVKDGLLNLSKSTSVTAVAGDLQIGDGTGGPASARVAIVNSNQIANSSTVTIASDGRLTLNTSRSDVIGALNASSSGASVVLSSGSTLTVGSGTAPGGTFAGTISGAGSLGKAGTGLLTLSGANSYDGATTVSAGTLRIQNGAALGSSLGATTVANAAALEMEGGITVGEALSVQGTGVGGTGALRSLSGNNTLAGNVTRTASATFATDAGHLTLSGSQSGNNTLTITGAGQTTISGNISGSGSAVVIKTGAGTLTLSGANSYLGRTEINGGTLSIGSDSNLGTAPASATSSHLSFAGGTLQSTADMTLNANRRITLNTGGGTFAPDGGTSLTYGGLISGTGGLTVSGNGTLRLSGSAGSNSYAGPTAVNSGTLALNKSAGQNAIGTAAVTLNAGGTLLLENTNQIADPTAIMLAGGSFSTGAGYSETLGVLTLSADSSITLGAAVHNLRFGASNLASWTPGAQLTIYGWTGIAGSSGNAGKIFFGTLATGLTSGQLSQITFQGYSGAQLLASGELVPVAVPEARALAAALLLAVAMGWLERRKIARSLTYVLQKTRAQTASAAP